MVEVKSAVEGRIMPDGDVVHNKLRRLYQRPYKWLCEGKASNEECARVAMESLKQDLKKNGDLPVMLAQIMGGRLSQIIGGVSSRSCVNWAALSAEFDRLIQQIDERHKLKEITLLAGKSVLNDLRYGREVEADSFSEAILHRYMSAVYESEFQECIPLVAEHYAGADEATLMRRVEEIWATIGPVIRTWAEKANLDGSVASLRLPPRCQVNPVDMDEDLCIAG